MAYISRLCDFLKKVKLMASNFPKKKFLMAYISIFLMIKYKISFYGNFDSFPKKENFDSLYKCFLIPNHLLQTQPNLTPNLTKPNFA